MRKLLRWILVPALILSLAGTVFAEGNVLRLRDVTAKKGETVYMTVELTEQVLGDTIGVSYTYDKDCLKPVVDSCSWARNGVLQNFDMRGGKGVWSVSQETDLTGGVCVLAFSVDDRAKFTKTTVACTVMVKNGGKTVGSYTAEGKVILDCEHTYGAWTDSEELGHTRICSECQGTQTQSHQWGDPVIRKDETGKNVAYYTCQICGGTRSIATTEEENIPTIPDSNEPVVQPTKPSSSGQTQPSMQTVPIGGQTQPAKPTASPGGNTEQTQTGPFSGNTDQSHKDHTHATTDPFSDNSDQRPEEHTHGTTGKLPEIEKDPQQTDPHAGHDHSHENSGSPSWVNAAVVLGVLAAFIGIAFYVIKKRK